MRHMVDQAVAILYDRGSLDPFGRLLNKSWMLKRELTSSVSNTTVDHIYKMAIDHGALGGKLLGAGSAGFMVFYVPLEQQKSVAEVSDQILTRTPV